MYTRSERRHNDWRKAIRKKKICDRYAHDWYDNLHQYSKNKIHCSCAGCCQKTNHKHKPGYTPIMDWKKSDRKKLESMADDYYENVGGVLSA